MAATSSSPSEHEAVIRPVPSIPTRLSLNVQTWLFKGLVVCALGGLRFVKRTEFARIAPTYLKRYGIRPGLECRVFIPKSYRPGEKIPLYIDIHGGGFALGDPQFDDKFCHYFANKYGYCIVSLEYRLAPYYPYPTAVDDCVELALAVLEDKDLPLDHNRVVMGGFSAGGNLTLAAAQHPKLKTMIKALVPIYPVVDFTSKYSGDFRDRPADSEGKGAKKDILRRTSHLFSWSYIPYGHDRTDPKLSTIFATRKDLPQPIYFLTMQYDKLCPEAFEMAKKLSGKADAKEEQDFQHNGIRWERVPDQLHGFFESDWQGELAPQDPLFAVGEGIFARIAGWLDEVWKENK